MKIFRKLSKKRYILLNVLFLIIFIAFLFPQKVFALDIPFILSGLLIPIISGLGKLLATLINLLITVAQYNTFINSAAVSRGWIIIRDICNMFFIIVLLVMAFSTVLNIEKYSIKRLLGSFLIAAILVNFSKLICGVLIDASQILMLTFVKAFSAAAEGNFITMLGLDKILMLNASDTISDNEVIGSLILGFIMTVVALVVIGIMTMILVFRIVILWFLVLLSPLAFVTSILPELQKYSSQWWQKFTSQIIVGPVMAFFIWLSLVVVSGNASGTSLLGDISQDEASQVLTETETSQDFSIEGKFSLPPFTIDQILDNSVAATVSEAGQPQYVLNFIIGIAMLVGSLMVAQQMGVVGSKMAGNAITKMQAMASGAAKLPLKPLDWGKKGLKRAGTSIGEVIHEKTGIPVLPSAIKRQYEMARRRLTSDRWDVGQKKRALIQKQWERHGWIPGTARFIGDVAGMGKRRIKQGTEDLKQAKEIRDKEKNSITENEKIELEQNKSDLIKDKKVHINERDNLQTGSDVEDSLEPADADRLNADRNNLVQNRDLNKNDLESLDKDLTLDTKRFIPLIIKAIQDLEKQANQAKADGDKPKADSLNEQALQIMELLPNIEEAENFEGKEFFQGNDNLKELVKTDLQNNLDSNQEEIDEIDIKLEKSVFSPEEKEKAKLDTEIFTPLIKQAIKDLEKDAEGLEGDARAEKKDEKKKQKLFDDAKGLRRQAKNAKQALPNIEETEKFEWKDIFKGNVDLEKNVNNKIGKEIDLKQKGINKADIELGKKIVPDEEKEKQRKDLKKADELEKIGLARIKSGQDISLPYGEYSKRSSGEEEEKRKLAELPTIYEKGEHVALAEKARTQEHDWAKYKAILKRMAGKGDWNEVLLKDQYRGDTKGKADWGRFLHEEFKDISYEESQGLVHELGTLAMESTQHRLDSPYLYDEIVPNSGVYEYKEKTEDEETQSYLYFSGIPDAETRARKEARLGTFAERPVVVINDKGEKETIGRAPILDDLAGIEIMHSYPSYHAETVGRPRLNANKVLYLGAPKTIEWIREKILPKAEEDLGKKDLQIFKDTINKLEIVWKNLGRPDPTAVPEGKVDIFSSENEQVNKELEKGELEKLCEKLESEGSQEELLKNIQKKLEKVQKEIDELNKNKQKND